MSGSHRVAARLVGLLAASLILVSVFGCAPSGPPDSPPSIRGVVTSAAVAADGGSLRVVWTDGLEAGALADYDAADVRVQSDTSVWRAGAQGFQSAEFGDIQVGDVVEAWFTGAVAESYPVQATASDVVIVGSYAGELPVPPGLEPEPAP